MIRKLLRSLNTLEKDHKLFSGKPERSHLSMIAEIVVKNLAKEIGADPKYFVHGNNETCMNDIEKLKNLARSFLILIDGSV